MKFTRFSMRTLLFMVTAVAIGIGLPELVRFTAFSVLKSHVNQDLTSLDDASIQKIRNATRWALRRRSSYESFDPWYLWQTRQNRFVYLERVPLTNIPGESKVRVTVLDNRGIALSCFEFQNAYRGDCVDAALITDNNLDCFLFHIITEWPTAEFVIGPTPRKCVYAIIENELGVVGAETLDGKRLAPTHWAGPSLNTPKAKQIIAYFNKRPSGIDAYNSAR